MKYDKRFLNSHSKNCEDLEEVYLEGDEKLHNYKYSGLRKMKAALMPASSLKISSKITFEMLIIPNATLWKED